jgi:hypothetical protein
MNRVVFFIGSPFVTRISHCLCSEKCAAVMVLDKVKNLINSTILKSIGGFGKNFMPDFDFRFLIRKRYSLTRQVTAADFILHSTPAREHKIT